MRCAAPGDTVVVRDGIDDDDAFKDVLPDNAGGVKVVDLIRVLVEKVGGGGLFTDAVAAVCLAPDRFLLDFVPVLPLPSTTTTQTHQLPQVVVDALDTLHARFAANDETPGRHDADLVAAVRPRYPVFPNNVRIAAELLEMPEVVGELGDARVVLALLLGHGTQFEIEQFLETVKVAVEDIAEFVPLLSIRDRIDALSLCTTTGTGASPLCFGRRRSAT
jgi:hypothetical protein